jgi:transketolase
VFGARFRYFVATGSELCLAVDAWAILAADGMAARVVAMPCARRFDQQDEAYRRQVLPPSVPVVAVEAGHPDLWWKYVGGRGAVIGIHRFGQSAPAGELYTFFAITVDSIVTKARLLAGGRGGLTGSEG